MLDPFAGVGTTLVEAYRMGNRAIGFEINPYACFAASVKSRVGELNAESVRDTAHAMSEFANDALANGKLPVALAA